MGGFESWAGVLGGILEVAGIPRFLGNLEDSRDDVDPNEQAFQGFTRRWWERFEDAPVTVATILPLADDLDLGGTCDLSRRVRLGKLLSAKRDTRSGDVRLVKAGGNRAYAEWRLVKEPMNAGPGAVGSKPEADSEVRKRASALGPLSSRRT